MHMTEIVAAVVASGERIQRNWRSVVDKMTNIQKKMHLAMRLTNENQKAAYQSLLDSNRMTYEIALRNEVMAVGCGDPGRVYLREGAELKNIAQRAEFSSKSIVNTYNYDLAQAIVAVGKDAPRANRYVYAYRLSQWERERSPRKNLEIGDTEKSWSINAAKEAFHRYNAIAARAEVVPYPTVCQECGAYVAGNPYESMSELYRQCALPAHPHCPHYGAAIMDAKLSREECQDLWIG
jgi:hypothetical protein